MSNELAILEKYIHDKFEYDSAGSLIDPLDAVVITPVNELQLTTSPLFRRGRVLAIIGSMILFTVLFSVSKMA
jgi:hypothetical protein